MVKQEENSRIVFMGTPEFASGCLNALCAAGMNVVAVVTAPDKPVGRGQKTGMSDVKKTALELGLPVLQPEKLKDPEFTARLAAYKADLQVVVAFRMLPQEVWSMPRLGTFNLHASLLPKYRGAAPIQRAVWNGEKESGVTTFLLDKKIDTGKVLFQEKIMLDDNETGGSLHDKLLAIGAPLVVKTARALFEGTATPVPQEELYSGETLPAAPKFYKEDCYLDFSKTARELQCQVRALSPYPGAVAVLNNEKKGDSVPVKILESEILSVSGKSYQQPGALYTDARRVMGATCSDGLVLSFKKLQMPGKKALTIEDFLRGFRIDNCGDIRFGKGY